MFSKLSLVLFFVLIFIFFLHPFDENGDFYHHINTGKYILQNHSFPHQDIFTHPFYGREWIAHSWLSGVIFYSIFKLWAGVGISFIVSLVAVLTFILLYKLIRSYKASKSATLLTLAFIVAPVAIRFPQRPEIFSYPLLIALLLVDKLKKEKPFLTLFIPFLILLWANLYGSGVILGLSILGLLIIKQFVNDHFKINQQSKLFYILTLVSYPLSLLNGYGIKSVFYFYLYIPKVSQYEGEWASIINIVKNYPLGYLLTFQYYILIYILFLITFILLLTISIKKVKSLKFESILSLSIFLPILAFRQLVTASIFSSLLIAHLISQLKHKLFFILILIISLISIALSLWVNPVGLISSTNPSKLKMIDFTLENKLKGKAFNHTHIGAYLTYYLYPDIKVFIDTRDEIFVGSKPLEDLYDTFSLGKNIIPLLYKYQIDLVIGDILTDNLSYRELFYSPNWAIVYFSDRYFIATTKDYAKNNNLTQLEFLDPYSQTGAKPGYEQEASNYYQKLINQGLDSQTNRSLLSSTLITLGKYDQAIKVISKPIDEQSVIGSLAASDQDYLLAESYLAKKDCSKTKYFLQKARSHTRPTFLFFINKPLPNKENKIKGFYYLICLNDKEKAKEYLDKFLAQPNITPLEKAKINKQFNDLLML